jgi:NADPH2:quinone reductase
LETVEPPELRRGTARVAVHSAAVNFPDLLVLAGTYQASVAPPYIPSCEFSGRVLEVADGVDRVRPGDIVFGLATHGAFAEQVVLDAARLTPVPDGSRVNLQQLAAFSVTYTTAYDALRTFANLQAGEFVTVLGASGGVGWRPSTFLSFWTPYRSPWAATRQSWRSPYSAGRSQLSTTHRKTSSPG